MRSALGLENFYLYGQSWGGMLAIEYALKYQKHLKGAGDLRHDRVDRVVRRATSTKLRARCRRTILAILEKYEAKGEYEAPEYQEAMYKGVYGGTSAGSTPGPTRSRARSSTSTPRSTTRCRAPTSSW